MPISRGLIMWLIVVLAVMSFVGLTVDEYEKHILILTGINILLAIGFDIVFGVAGQVALAQGAFFGIGAYTSAIMVMNGWPVWSGVVAGVVINIVLATAIAAPALRVRGEYLLLLSLGFAIVVYEVLLNWVSVTGGPMGISGIPSLGTFQPFGYEINFSRKTPNLWMVICAVMVGIGIAAILRNSYFGRTFRAVRDDPEAAAATGINVGMTLLLAFCISAVYASFSGSLYAHYLRILDPASFSAVLAIEILIMCVVGGRDSLLGPVIGAFLVVGLPELFRPLAEYRLVLFGACIVAILIFLPGGLASLLNRQIWAKWRGRGA